MERMLLLEQQDDDQNQNNHMKVTLDDFAMVLLAWAKCRDYSKHDPTPAQKAQHWWSRMQDRLALLEQNTVNNHDMSLLADKEMEQKMVKTMRRSYNACLDAWAQRSGPHKKGQMAAQKALDLFETMQQNNNPDLSSSLSTQNQRNHPILQQVTPDAFSYSSVVTALTRLQTRADTAHAERLVDEMTSPSSLSSPHHNHTMTTTFIQPNVFLYTTLINGVAHSYQSLEGARKAEAILNRMSMPITGSGRNHLHPVQPNSHTYQGVLTVRIRTIHIIMYSSPCVHRVLGYTQRVGAPSGDHYLSQTFFLHSNTFLIIGLGTKRMWNQGRQEMRGNIKSYARSL
jgi:hypothetical protein